MITARLYLFLVLILSATFFRAQNKAFTFQHYGPEEGLSSTNIQALKQGPDGLMYVVSQNGIYTFDGLNFEKLKISNFKSNFITNVYFNNNELLILNREEGVFNYSKNTRTAAKLPYKLNDPDELVISGDLAYSLSNQTKVNAFNIKTGTFSDDEITSKSLARKEEVHNQAYCIFKTSQGKVLVGRSDGLYIFEGTQQRKITEVKNIPVYSITENAEKKIVLGSSNRILVLEGNYKVVKELFPRFKASKTFLASGEKTINKLLVDKYDRYWFTSFPDNNLFLFENNTLYDVFETLNIPTVLINSITKDKDENIWIGTFTDGVYFVQNPFMNNYSFNYNSRNLPVNEPLILNNIVIAATNNGLYAYDLKNQAIKTISEPDNLFPEPIHNIAYASGQFYFSKRNSFARSAVSNFSGLKFKAIDSKFIYPVSDKQAIICDYSTTLLKIDLVTQKVIDTLYSFSDYRTRISSMLMVNNQLFIGTSGGLGLLDLKSKKLVYDPNFNFSINNLALINGKVFIAHDGGFSIYEDKKLYDRLGEVRLSPIKKIKFHNNILWLATLNGLYMCDTRFDPITVYNKSNGLLSNAINDISFDKDNVCIATDRGISVTSVTELLKNKSKPDPVVIDHYQLDTTDLFSFPQTLKASASQNNLFIYFSSPFFTKPNKQLFRYSEDGGKWITLNSSPLQYPLRGGKHRVQIYTSADGINWSEPVGINIEKEIPFSESGMLYALISAAALLIVLIVSYVWIKQVKKKALKRVKEEQQINLLKHQAMNSLLSPHFIFNSLTSIQNYINTNNSLMASEYLAKFSRLIRMIIEKASQSHITLRDEVVRLNYYLDLEKERFKNKFDFTIEVDKALDVDTISIPNMIIQPHAENSIIHGILPKNEHGTLRIHFGKSDRNELLITIEDNGIGLNKAKEHAKTNHKSLGTSTIANILELNSKLFNKKQSVKMEDKSNLNPASNGTLITITLEL